MRYSRLLIMLTLVVGVSSNGRAQRCSTGPSDGSATPERMAAANVDILFEGTKLTREQRNKAITIYADAFKALLKLDYRAADYQAKFDGLLAKRNEDSDGRPTDSAKAQLEARFGR